MTNVYFVRHAQPDPKNHDNLTRGLTEKGLKDRKEVTAFFQDKCITAIYSSPYKRSVDTVKEFADQKNLPVKLIPEFRERTVTDTWIPDEVFQDYTARQWADLDYKLSGGESLREVQARNISALSLLLEHHPGESIIIGSHGTALGTVLAYYDPSFGFQEFKSVLPRMPYIVQFTFDGHQCIRIHRQ